MVEKNFSYHQYIHQQLSVGRFSFTIDEVVQQSGSDRKTVQVSLSRLVQKGAIALIRRGFYAIISPEFSVTKSVPPLLYIHDLMQYMQKDYYISLLSAAALQGAAHQQPMQFFVTIKTPAVRDIVTDKNHISFNAKQQWNENRVKKIKTRTGYANISTPEATMLDMVENQRTFGWGRVLTVVEELYEHINKTALRTIAADYPTPVVQRLGYILDDLLHKKDISTPLLAILSKKDTENQYLSLAAQKQGALNPKWKIITNDTIESNLL